MMTKPTLAPTLRAAFGDRLQENVRLAPYTSARIGGPADFLLEARSADELAATAQTLWDAGVPFLVLGGGSNVLVSDRGVRGVVVLNRAKAVTFQRGEPPSVYAQSGVVFSNLANRAASQGFGGLEWAATIPGTVGGAVYGNAGAFGGDMARDLIYADVLVRGAGRQQWPVEKMEYGYRTSILKRGDQWVIILGALIRLQNSTPETARGKIEQFTARRKSTQPPGASMGSMFKNPPGDFAGRLIEAAGLKGARIGNAEISTVHANFFLNTGETSSQDIRALIELAQKTVAEKFGVALELEVQLIGDWND